MFLTQKGYECQSLEYRIHISANFCGKRMFGKEDVREIRVSEGTGSKKIVERGRWEGY